MTIEDKETNRRQGDNMSKFDFDIGILGGGAAGLTVASGAAQFGAKTLLIEKEKALGGDCLHYGCVPSKTLIRTSHVYHMMKNSRKYGLPGVDIPPVDYRDIAKRIQYVINTIQKHDSEERFCKLGVKVEFGITNKEIFSLDRLPRTMIVIGAGPIAMEMAQSFCRLGTQVHVIQRSGQILSKEDRDLADIVMNVLGDEGITFHLDAGLVSVKENGTTKEVIIRNKDGSTESLMAEQILVALGRQANLQGLGLEDISINYDKKGLNVDNRMRTNHKHIYGAGDVTGAYQFTHAAGYEGGVALSNAILHLPKSAHYTYMPWCTYTDPELASIGMNEKRAKEAGIKYTVWKEEFKANDRSLAEGIAVMNGGVKLSIIASAVHTYPTLAEINKRVVGNYFSGKIFSEKVKKTLKFFFHFKGRACE
jgi:pyruvate/2-oxoglutarate dehydrogenase complex dihydrolipoamide dehydrogenase (E3) component